MFRGPPYFGQGLIRDRTLKMLLNMSLERIKYFMSRRKIGNIIICESVAMTITHYNSHKTNLYLSLISQTDYIYLGHQYGHQKNSWFSYYLSKLAL